MAEENHTQQFPQFPTAKPLFNNPPTGKDLLEKRSFLIHTNPRPQKLGAPFSSLLGFNQQLISTIRLGIRDL
jgi:hypothetical protein